MIPLQCTQKITHQHWRRPFTSLLPPLTPHLRSYAHVRWQSRTRVTRVRCSRNATESGSYCYTSCAVISTREHHTETHVDFPPHATRHRHTDFSDWPPTRRPQVEQAKPDPATALTDKHTTGKPPWIYKPPRANPHGFTRAPPQENPRGFTSHHV